LDKTSGTSMTWVCPESLVSTRASFSGSRVMKGNSYPIVLRKPEPLDLAALYVQKNDPEVKCMLGGFSRPTSKRD